MPRAQPRPIPCDFAQDRAAEASGLAGLHGQHRLASGLSRLRGRPGALSQVGPRGLGLCSTHSGRSVRTCGVGPRVPFQGHVAVAVPAVGGHGRWLPRGAVLRRACPRGPHRASCTFSLVSATRCPCEQRVRGCAPASFLSGLWAAVHGGHLVWVETSQRRLCDCPQTDPAET